MRHLHVLLLAMALLSIPATLAAQGDTAVNISPLFTSSDGLTPDEHVKVKAWIDTRLETLANTRGNISASERATARQEIVDNVGPQNAKLGGQRRRDVVPILADDMRKYLDSKDPLTAVNVALILANIRHLHMVSVLTDGVSNANPAIRYCAAQGLAASQADMAAIGLPKQWSQPLKALVTQAGKEDNVYVAQAIYDALRLNDPRRLNQPDRQLELYKAFVDAFAARIALLDQRKLSSARAEAHGVAVAADWMKNYRTDGIIRARLLELDGQLLKYAVSLLGNAESEKLTESQQEDLAEVATQAAKAVLAASDELLLGTNDQRTAVRLQKLNAKTREDLSEGRWLFLQLDVNQLVGAKGEPDFVLKSLGVREPAKELTPPASSGANSTSQPN
ncbi:MAG: hypothetical protein BIFFINMI_02336 [Phycisphaerae bacterium]|nr:hypothetical protein [Phycisphaerae bacterium]